jgi:hypothetical protein
MIPNEGQKTDNTGYICFKCVAEEFLSNLIRKTGKRNRCSYCRGTRRSFSIEEMADVVEGTLDEHFHRTSTEPSSMEYTAAREGLRDWYRHGDPVADVIGEMAQIDAELAEDIRSVLYNRHFDIDEERMGEENPFCDEAHYEERGVGDGDLKFAWEEFERRLKTEARYFSGTAQATLKAIFEDIGDHRTVDGKPVVVEGGPGTDLTVLYRARVFQQRDHLVRAIEKPDQEVGPPPSPVAAAGRMNARGIAVFYGATAADVAIAEVRPPVGSKVVTGRFELIRPVRLLDVEALRSIRVRGSLFDKGYTVRLQKAKFLEDLSARIIRAVMPDDEPFEYLATQAVADYLATENDPALDGIIYPSVQAKDGRNVVLFHQSARVEAWTLPKGTQTSVHLQTETDGDDDFACTVFEEMPPELPAAPAEVNPDPFAPRAFEYVRFDPDEELECDYRSAVLKLDAESVAVHIVKAVAFTTEEHPVRRYRVSSNTATPVLNRDLEALL